MNDNNKNTNNSTLLNIAGLVKIHWKFISFITLAMVLIVVLYSLIMPQTYQSGAKLLPPQNNNQGGGLSSFLQNVTGGNVVFGNIGGGTQVTVIAEILRSRTVGEYIADRMNFNESEEFKGMTKEEIAYMVQNMLEVEIERSGLISITSSYSTSYFPNDSEIDTAAQYSARIANFAIDGLEYYLLEKNISNAKQTKKFIQKKLVQYRKQLDSVEGELEIFRSENKVLSIDEQTMTIIDQAADVGAELNKALIDLTLAKQEFSDNSPKVKAYQRTVDLLKQQYEKIQKGGLIEEDQFSIPLSNAPKLIRQYEELMRKQKILEKVILYLETQKHQEEIQGEKDMPTVNVLDDAIVPTQRAAPSRKLMVILGFIFSALISTSIVIARAYFKGNLLVNNED